MSGDELAAFQKEVASSIKPELQDQYSQIIGVMKAGWTAGARWQKSVTSVIYAVVENNTKRALGRHSFEIPPMSGDEILIDEGEFEVVRRFVTRGVKDSLPILYVKKS